MQRNDDLLMKILLGWAVFMTCEESQTPSYFELFVVILHKTFQFTPGPVAAGLLGWVAARFYFSAGVLSR